MVHIIAFEEQYAADFRSLNLHWLTTYNLLESHDLMVLDDPLETIIRPGGCIYLAKENEQVIGSAALMKEHEGIYELVKMAVHPLYQGRGISKMLLQSCIEKAREWKAVKLTLFSNHRLTAALRLYGQFGFVPIPVENSPFTTADVKMELIL
jgi:putative acetyltransferase